MSGSIFTGTMRSILATVDIGVVTVPCFVPLVARGIESCDSSSYVQRVSRSCSATSVVVIRGDGDKNPTPRMFRLKDL